MDEAETQQDIRRTDVLFLPKVGASIREYFADSGIEESRWQGICAESLSAQCTICEEKLSGEEWADWLLNVSTAEFEPKEGMRWIRLKQGLCASEKCNVLFYNIHLEPHPEVDWSAINIGALGGKEGPKAATVVELAGDAAKESIAKQFTKRTVATLVVLVVLWMFHQWYRGGSIPLLRPAQDYTTTVDPDADFLKVEPRQ